MEKKRKNRKEKKRKGRKEYKKFPSKRCNIDLLLPLHLRFLCGSLKLGNPSFFLVACIFSWISQTHLRFHLQIRSKDWRRKKRGEKLKLPRIWFWLILEVYCDLWFGQRGLDGSELARFHGDRLVSRGSVNQGISCFCMIMKIFGIAVAEEE